MTLQLKADGLYVDGRGRRVRIGGLVKDSPKKKGARVFWSTGGDWYREDGAALTYDPCTGTHPTLRSWCQLKNHPQDLAWRVRR